eukprot:2723727-Prymnesium_polylepis.1
MDLLPLNFDFGTAPAGGSALAQTAAASTAGDPDGGDPGSGGPSESSEASRPLPASIADLDPRTRALDEWTGWKARTIAARDMLTGKEPTVWVAAGGELSLGPIKIIDFYVRQHKLSQKAKLEMTVRQQLIATRKRLDEERELRLQAEVELVKQALQPQRDRRLLEYERGARISERQQARETITAMEKSHAAELKQVRKELRAEAAAVRLQYEGDARAARVKLKEQLLRVQLENTELERKMTSMRYQMSQLRRTSSEALSDATAAKENADAEVARVKDHGRAWAAFREQAARAQNAEVLLEASERRVEELEARLCSVLGTLLHSRWTA